MLAAVTRRGVAWAGNHLGDGVLHHQHVGHLAELSKVLAQLLGARLPAQTADEQFAGRRLARAAAAGRRAAGGAALAAPAASVQRDALAAHHHRARAHHAVHHSLHSKLKQTHKYSIRKHIQ